MSSHWVPGAVFLVRLEASLDRAKNELRSVCPLYLVPSWKRARLQHDKNTVSVLLIHYMQVFRPISEIRWLKKVISLTTNVSIITGLSSTRFTPSSHPRDCQLPSLSSSRWRSGSDAGKFRRRKSLEKFTQWRKVGKQVKKFLWFRVTTVKLDFNKIGC